MNLQELELQHENNSAEEINVLKKTLSLSIILSDVP